MAATKSEGLVSDFLRMDQPVRTLLAKKDQLRGIRNETVSFKGVNTRSTQSMSLKHTASTGAILSLCIAFAPAPALAQPVNCAELYNHVMAVYQAAPLSPQYNQIAAAYSANCLAGASAAAYPPIDPQDYGAYYQPPYSAYAEPDYPYYGGYGYAVPVGVGIGLGFGGGFRRGGDSHDHGGFHGAGFHNGGDPHGGGHSGGGHGGDHREHH